MSERDKLVEAMARAICASVGEDPDAHHFTMHETVFSQWSAWEHAALDAIAAAEAAGWRLVPPNDGR